ncbi:MAG: hypothetical protein AMXMBFR53_40990 [Gemmatimonadota bacterium]
MSERWSSDPRLVVLARRVEPWLWLTALLMAYAAVTDGGIAALLYGPAAVGLALMLALHRYAGVPGHALLRWASAAVGAVLLLGGVALVGVGVWFLFLGSFAILGGLVAIPLGLGAGTWGYSLLAAALSGAAPARPLDLDEARRSDAVRRFDELHRPRPPEGGGDAGDRGAGRGPS